MQSRVSAVLFDLDNTLVFEDGVTRKAFAEASAVAAGHADPDLLASAAEAEAELLWRAGPDFVWADGIGISAGEALWGSFAGPGAELASLRASAPRFRRAVWNGALARCGVTDARLAAELDRRFERARLASEPLDPDAEAVLDELCVKHRLALVTNGAPAIQRAKVALTDLGRRFDEIVVSGEVGAGKPDPRPIHAALAALEVRPEEAVMVGDSLERDIVAARAAGVYAVWLDRETPGTSGSLASEAGMRPDARITGLRELPALLGALALRNASR